MSLDGENWIDKYIARARACVCVCVCVCVHLLCVFVYLCILVVYYLFVHHYCSCFYLQVFLPLVASAAVLAAIQSTAVKAPTVKRGHLEVNMQT